MGLLALQTTLDDVQILSENIKHSTKNVLLDKRYFIIDIGMWNFVFSWFRLQPVELLG